MKRKRHLARMIFADVCLVAGMAATVIGLGMDSLPLAIFVGGAELMFVGIALALGRPRGGDGT